MKVFVITCNDSVEHVVKGSAEFAQAKLEELKEAYFRQWRGNFSAGGQNPEARDEYNLRCHWASRPTELTEQS